MDAEYVEVCAGDQRAMNVAGATVLDRNPCDSAIRRDARATLEQLTGFDDSFDVGTAKRVMARSGTSELLPGQDQSVLIAHRQRAQEHPVDHGKHHGRASDAQRERQRRSGCEGFGSRQPPACGTDVLLQSLEHGDHASMRIHAPSQRQGEYNASPTSRLPLERAAA